MLECFVDLSSAWSLEVERCYSAVYFRDNGFWSQLEGFVLIELNLLEKEECYLQK